MTGAPGAARAGVGVLAGLVDATDPAYEGTAEILANTSSLLRIVFREPLWTCWPEHRSLRFQHPVIFFGVIDIAAGFALGQQCLVKLRPMIDRRALSLTP